MIEGLKGLTPFDCLKRSADVFDEPYPAMDNWFNNKDQGSQTLKRDRREPQTATGPQTRPQEASNGHRPSNATAGSLERPQALKRDRREPQTATGPQTRPQGASNGHRPSNATAGSLKRPQALKRDRRKPRTATGPQTRPQEASNGHRPSNATAGSLKHSNPLFNFFSPPQLIETQYYK
jgi:hypothetical protein